MRSRHRSLLRYEGQTPAGDAKTTTPGQKQQVLLDETDDLWTELRHQHIGVVTQSVARRVASFIRLHELVVTLSRSITKKIKDFAVQKRVKDSDRGERTTMKDLSYVTDFLARSSSTLLYLCLR